MKKDVRITYILQKLSIKQRKEFINLYNKDKEKPIQILNMIINILSVNNKELYLKYFRNNANKIDKVIIKNEIPNLNMFHLYIENNITVDYHKQYNKYVSENLLKVFLNHENKIELTNYLKTHFNFVSILTFEEQLKLAEYLDNEELLFTVISQNNLKNIDIILEYFDNKKLSNKYFVYLIDKYIQVFLVKFSEKDLTKLILKCTKNLSENTEHFRHIIEKLEFKDVKNISLTNFNELLKNLSEEIVNFISQEHLLNIYKNIKKDFNNIKTMNNLKAILDNKNNDKFTVLYRYIYEEVCENYNGIDIKNFKKDKNISFVEYKDFLQNNIDVTNISQEHFNIIYTNIDEKLKEILNDIIKLNSQLHLALFLFCVDVENFQKDTNIEKYNQWLHGNDDAQLTIKYFDIKSYNKILDIYNKNKNPKKQKVNCRLAARETPLVDNEYLNDEDYKFLEEFFNKQKNKNITVEGLDLRLYIYSILYKRNNLFKGNTEITRIDENKELKNVDMFKCFKLFKNLNIELNDIGSFNREALYILYSTFSKEKDIINYINVIANNINIPHLHNYTKLFLNVKDNINKNNEHYKDTLLYCLNNVKFNRYKDGVKFLNLMLDSFDKVYEEIKYKDLNLLKEEDIVKTFINYGSLYQYQYEEFKIASDLVRKDICYFDTDKKIIDSEYLLKDNIFSSNNLSFYEDVIDTMYNTDIKEKELLQPFKGIYERNGKIYIYEFVNLKIQDKKLSVDNCKALLSHEPLSCCLTANGVASEMFEFYAINSNNTGFKIVSELNMNSQDILNEIKLKIESYNNGTLNFEEQNNLSTLISSNSNIVSASATYIVEDTLCFDNEEIRMKEKAIDDNGVVKRYNPINSDFMYINFLFAQKVFELNLEIKEVTMGRGW